MKDWLSPIQRALEAIPVRGKGRLADLLLAGKNKEVTCHPLPGLAIHLHSEQRIERLMWAGAYERGLVRILKSFLKPGMVFADLGANIGYFSAIAAALVGATGHVFAFEPCPRCFLSLQRNLSGFEQAVVCNWAASDTVGPAFLYFHANEDGWGSLFPAPELINQVQVNTIRLDDWARQAGPPRLDFLKIDIEGSEYAALRGAQEVLRRFRPIVIAELNRVCLARDRRSPEDVVRLLCAAGYRCERRADGLIATPA